MEHNKIKIIDFGENKPADRIYLNGKQLDKEEIKQYVTECMRGVHNESQN